MVDSQCEYEELILNSVTDLIALYEVTPDQQFRVLKGNNSFYESLGLDKKQVDGKYIQDLLDKETANTWIRNNRDTVMKGQARSIVENYGDYGIYEVNTIPIRHQSSKFNRLLVTARDITEKTRIEEEIITSNRTIIGILENITDAFYALDSDWNFIYINKGAENILLRSRQDLGDNRKNLLGKNFWDVFPEYINSVVWDHYNRAMNDKIPAHFEIQAVYCKIDIEIHVCPSNNGISVYFRDITEQKKLDKEIARLESLNLIGEMSASIAHEIRNPLTTVRGFLQLLGQREKETKKNEYYKLMIEELDRSNSIITEFLSLAKDKAIELQPASLDYIIDTLYPLLSSNALEQNKRIMLDKGKVPDIAVNEKEVRQIILNLVKNALDAVSPGAVVTIGTYMQDDEIVLYVEDEGTGIAPGIIDKLGIPFTTTKENGTGLGLAVCYSIVNRHNAKMEVETDDTGTTFYVRFKMPQYMPGEQVS